MRWTIEGGMGGGSVVVVGAISWIGLVIGASQDEINISEWQLGMRSKSFAVLGAGSSSKNHQWRRCLGDFDAGKRTLRLLWCLHTERFLGHFSIRK